MGRGQPLVYILGHAFKIGAVNLAPFNRDYTEISIPTIVLIAAYYDDAY